MLWHTVGALKAPGEMQLEAPQATGDRANTRGRRKWAISTAKLGLRWALHIQVEILLRTGVVLPSGKHSNVKPLQLPEHKPWSPISAFLPHYTSFIQHSLQELDSLSIWSTFTITESKHSPKWLNEEHKAAEFSSWRIFFLLFQTFLCKHFFGAKSIPCKLQKASHGSCWLKLVINDNLSLITYHFLKARVNQASLVKYNTMKIQKNLPKSYLYFINNNEIHEVKII